MMEIPSTGSLAIKDPAVTVIYGLAGWALCGATMGMAMKAATLETALIVHAVAAPCIFTGLSLHYFHRSTAWSPIQAAATFLCVVILMDVLVVALLIERSFGMF